MSKIVREKAKNSSKGAFNKNVGRINGLEIWRIEKFEPVPYPKSNYGKFYTGDSFIVLNTKETNGFLSHDIHFWLGKETTQDKAASAAILTVHLDDYLGGGPVQHREVQEHESPLFLSYFKKGIRYLEGGVDGGFRKVAINANDDKRLFHVKGKRNIRVRQVDLGIQSMNQNDYFILDSGPKIFVYPPTKMNNFQKTKANEIAKQIRDQDHNGRATVHILDHPISLEERREFFGILGCKSNNPELPDAPQDGDDAIELQENANVTLYNATTKAGYSAGFVSGLLEISTKPLTQEMLKGDICSILDTGRAIFVWIGKDATTDDKSHAMVKAQELIAKRNYPNWTPIHRIVEGAEGVQFKQYFSTWTDKPAVQQKRTAGDTRSN